MKKEETKKKENERKEDKVNPDFLKALLGDRKAQKKLEKSGKVKFINY